MKRNHGMGAIKALGGRIAAVLLGVICAVCVTPPPRVRCRLGHS